MTIIFLDIDGVLNNPGTYKKIDPSSFCVIERSLVEKLNKITERTNARIVLSSSWKHVFKRQFGNSVKVNDMFKHAFGMYGEIIGFTPDVDMGCRGDEISEWLENHNYKWVGKEIKSFIILDDDNDMGALLPHLVKVNGVWGLSDKNVIEAINKLNKVVPEMGK